MRKILLLLFFSPWLSLAQFNSSQIIDSLPNYVRDITFIDFTNNGYQDLITVTQGGNGNVYIYPNDSTPLFYPKSGLSTNGYSNIAVTAADYDSNGWNDIAVLSNMGTVTIYYQYLGSPGNFIGEHDIGTGIFLPLNIRTADFNRDGYPDLATVADRSIIIYYNNQDQTFTPDTVAKFTEFYSFGVGDLNGDSYPDIIAGSGRFYTFLNDGIGNLIRDTTNEHLQSALIMEIELADLDGDLDLDIVVYYTNTIDKIEWYSNDGNGVISKETVITSVANNVHQFSIGDIDLDGKNDLCTSYDQTQVLNWIQNLGSGSFSSEILIDGSLNYPSVTSLADFDNDQDLDLVVYSGSGLMYYNNHSLTTSIPKMERSHFLVYPNPSNGQIYIQTNECDVRIYSTSGILVWNGHLPKGTNPLNLFLESGAYFIQWVSEDSFGTERFLVVE